MAGVITHSTITGAAADTTALVDGPKWDANHTITGTFTVAQGGTGITSGTSGGINYYVDATTLASSALLTQYGLVYGGGAGAAPVTTAAMTNGQLLVGQTSAAPLPKTISGDATVAASGAITIAANAVTNAKMATMAAYTIKSNATGGAAVPTDVDISALTTKASPTASDWLLISDQAASGALKKAAFPSGGSVTSVTAAGILTASTNPIVATGTLNVNASITPQGRITLTSLTPVMATSVSGATIVYYTPCVGNLVPIYDGTNMVPTATAEISQATTDATKSPAAVAASKVYDLFVWSDSGTVRCTRGPAWTNATTRGYTLTMVNGILLNTSLITNGPAASRGTWVGTIASNASSTIDYIFGASASGGVAAVLNIWNTYNRVLTSTSVVDTGVSYTYASGTIRQARASAGNQISFVVGSQEETVQWTYSTDATTGAVATNALYVGVGFDSTTTYNGPVRGVASPTANAYFSSGVSSGVWFPAIGTHFLSANEASISGTSTFNAGSFADNNTLIATLRN